MRVAEHCVRHKAGGGGGGGPPPPPPPRSVGGGSHNTEKLKEEDLRPRTYTLLLEDTGFATIGELRTEMLDQSDWRGRIHVVRASA